MRLSRFFFVRCRLGYAFSCVTTRLDQPHQQELALRLQSKAAQPDSTTGFGSAAADAIHADTLFELLAARAGGEPGPSAMSYLVPHNGAPRQLPSLLDVSRSIGHRFGTRVSPVPFLHPLESLLAVLQCHFAPPEQTAWDAIRGHPLEGAAGFVARRQAALEQLKQEVSEHLLLQQHRTNFAKSGAALKLAVEAFCLTFDCTLLLCVSKSTDEQQQRAQFAFGAALKEHIVQIGNGKRYVCAASFGYCEFALMGDCCDAEVRRWRALVEKDNPRTRSVACSRCLVTQVRSLT
jgi:hypothetical protein